MFYNLQQKLKTIIFPLVLLLAILGTTSCTQAPPNTAQETPTTPSLQSLQAATDDPVLFVHGIDPKNSSFNCDDNTWGDAKEVLEGTKYSYPVYGQQLNWEDSQKLITIGYYSGDNHCNIYLSPTTYDPTTLNNSNDPNDWDDSGFADDSKSPPKIPDDPKAFQKCDIAGIVTNGTSIEQLACLIAWYIWDNFSDPNGLGKGQNIRVVAHSMGGLIIRYAIFASKDECIQPSFTAILTAASKNIEPLSLSFRREIPTMAKPAMRILCCHRQ